MREFTTAAKAKAGEESDEPQFVEFKHDGRVVRFLPPTGGQMAVAMAATVGGGSGLASAGDFIAFMFEIMDEPTRRYFKGRLLDRNDDFDINSPGGLADIWEGLIEEWTGNPTQEPSGSTPSLPSTGRASTAKRQRRASTSSTSRRTASATPSTDGESSD